MATSFKLNPITGKLDLVDTGGAGGTWVEASPTGTIDGSNKNFTLPSTPISGSLLLMLGRQPQVLSVDFTLAGSTISYVTAPDTSLSSEPHIAKYQV
jgi:hypothetical protein